MPLTERTDPSWIPEVAAPWRTDCAQDISVMSIGTVRARAASALGLIASRRRRIVVPLLLLSLGSYVATLVVFVYFPDATAKIVTGSINVAYTLALTQFLVTFAVALLYSATAAKWVDPVTEDALGLYVALSLRGQHD
jgi:uncharacterized membrane protein (DUF485 family)